jgi:hypothetical protein
MRRISAATSSNVYNGSRIHWEACIIGEILPWKRGEFKRICWSIAVLNEQPYFIGKDLSECCDIVWATA